MWILGVDIVLIIAFHVYFNHVTKEEKGLFSITIPYLYGHMMIWRVPIALTFINLLLIWLTSYTITLAFMPLTVTGIALIYETVKIALGAYNWHMHIVPMEKKIKKFLFDKGYKDPSQICVNPWRKSITVKLYKEDKEPFVFQEKQINEEFKEKFFKGRYENYWGGIYVTEFETRKNA